MKTKIPGSIFEDKKSGKITVKFKGKCYYTGLSATNENFKVAADILKKIYFEYMGIRQPSKSAKMVHDVFNTEFLPVHCRNLMPKTISGYKDALKKVFPVNTVLAKNNIESGVLSLLNDAKLSNTSKNIHIRGVNVFLSFCAEKNYIEKIDLNKCFKQKAKSKEVKIYTDNEIKLLLDYLNFSNETEFYLLIKFLLLTGSRIGEALELEKKDITDVAIYFRNKIDKEPEMFFIGKELKELLTQIKEMNKSNEKLFRWQSISKSFLRKKLYLFLENAGIERNGRCFHEFRKTFLFKLFKQGTPLQIAQKLMRHRNIDITIKHYTFYERSELLSYSEKIKVG